MAEASLKQIAWPMFDRIIADAAATPQFESGPWVADEYHPDIETLQKLLGVPRQLNDASSQSGGSSPGVGCLGRV